MRGIHRRPVNSPHKGPVTRIMFPFDDVIMNLSVRTSADKVTMSEPCAFGTWRPLFFLNNKTLSNNDKQHDLPINQTTCQECSYPLWYCDLHLLELSLIVCQAFDKWCGKKRWLHNEPCTTRPLQTLRTEIWVGGRVWHRKTIWDMRPNPRYSLHRQTRIC